MNQLQPRLDKSLVKIKHYDYYVGIDVGTNTGVAVWDRKYKRFQSIGTYMLHQALENIAKINQHYVGLFMVRIEGARTISWKTKDPKADNARAQGAGSVKRDAAIWEEFLTDKNIPFEKAKPGASLTKLKADKFKMITGYTGLTSSHARDAAMLVFGI